MARQVNYEADFQVIELLQNMATPERGLTSHQIADMLEIPYPTVRRIIKRIEHAKVAKFPKSVKGYYWDPRTKTIDQAPVGKDENQFGKVTAEFRPTGNKRSMDTPVIAARVNQVLQDGMTPRVARFVEALMAAHDHSVKFHNQGGELDRGVYLEFNEAANDLREVAEYFCKVAASYQDHEKFDTPEFWSVFLDV